MGKYSIGIGSSTMVVICSAKLAEEVTKTQDLAFCSRPSFLSQQKISYNGHDVAFAPYNENWRELRKVCVVHLLSLKKVLSFSSINKYNYLLIAFGIRYDEEAHGKRRFKELLAVTRDSSRVLFL
ncbi:hypothetical protein FXO38_35333 [Capsicum annuum]|uniref:Uncharacterized protein n=1 Tax=Capsicum annuum TaxID=4072 RepID=A0A2G2Z7X6_CAPAN|nr:hypothetical protein FXO38_35333 [Capsicum annuum]PHT77965.1 hypothetical protein T459_16017 [Capsicum annuum]